jgi:Tfp pilus assembly protein PilN
MMSEMNLLDPKINSSSRRRWTNLVVAGTILSALTFVAFFSWYLLLQADLRRSLILESQLRREHLELERIEQLIRECRQKRSDLERKSTHLNRLLRDREKPIQVLMTVERSMPIDPSISLQRLSRVQERIHITGACLDLRAVTEFVTHLDASSLFKSVELRQLESEGQVSRFDILCLLKE